MSTQLDAPQTVGPSPPIVADDLITPSSYLESAGLRSRSASRTPGQAAATLRHDPHVARIHVFCHDEFDITYVREDARWVARSPIRT